MLTGTPESAAGSRPVSRALSVSRGVITFVDIPQTYAACLEGAVMAVDFEHALVSTLAAVAVRQCVVPTSIRQVLDRESGLGPGILRISPEESLPEIG
jgi:hypothetical protein